MFRGRRGDLIKVIWWDGQGACLFSKRLERGRIVWPSVADGKFVISTAQRSMLLEGIDWRAPQPSWRPLTVGDACGLSNGKLKRLGEDITEELEYIPGRFVVNWIMRPRMACAGCETFHQAALPSRPIERGRPWPGLLAHVLINKCADHLPLYR